ncbi:uncharacterized protein LOC110832340 isoform X2 [Zootermopsis nevadensis]|uniref:uncharacterized protein LOC110832340 isoform X2 n=1 Tax=Zootermopsis nevadensis TaxID=136037 RepID=UPI000B8EC076|nr:uncharacterized protein LOC110832340 isoform X2 [Zootermopsis nevadensis]
MIADTADENKYGEILRPDVRLDDRFCTEQNEKEKLEGCLVQVTEDLVCERQQRRELEYLVFSQKATISELLEDEGQSLYEGSEVRDQLEAFVLLSQELYTQAQELIKFLTHSEETYRNQAAELQNEKGKLEGRLVQLTQDLVCERQQRRELEDLVFSQRATISELLEEKEQSLNNGSEVRDQLKACILLNQGFKAQVQEFMKVITHCEETHCNQTAEGEKTVKPVACATESGVAINNEVSVNFPSQLLPAAPTPVVSAPTPLVSAPTPLLSAPTPNMPQATNPVEAEALHCLGHYLMLPVRTKTEKNRQKRTRYKMNKRMKKAAEGEKTSVKPVACATESGVTINNEVSVNFPSPLLAAAPIPVVSAPTPVVPAPTPNMPQATNLDEAEALRLLARYLMLPVRTKTEKNRQKRTRYKMNKRMKKAAEVWRHFNSMRFT